MKAELIVDAPIIDKKEIWVKKIHKPHFDHPFHFHQFCELVWIEKSYGKVIIGDYTGNFAEGELIMEGPELPHLYRCDTVFYQQRKGLCTKALSLYFPSTLIPTITDHTETLSLYGDLLDKSKRGLRFYGKTRTEVIELIKKINQTDGIQQLGYFLMIVYILNKTTEFEYLASISYKNQFDNKRDMNRFNEVCDFMLKNFHRNIMLQEVAAICNMTPNAFCRYFKTRTQKTFIRFLNEIRIGHACKLLQHDDLSIQQICYECGYNNPANFFKFFKFIAHKTPKEYRDSLKVMIES
jgi:AraC-like DNA-binding protein